MTKGKPWPTEDERKLREWFESGIKDIGVLVFSFEGQYTEQGIRHKLERLGLLKEEGGGGANSGCPPPSDVDLPVELFSVEEALKKMASALQALEKKGLTRDEVLRLRGIIAGARVYKELIADYINYRALEAELSEWRNKYEALAKEKQEP